LALEEYLRRRVISRRGDLHRKTIWLAIYTAACATLFLNPLHDLFRLSRSSDAYSHILVIPFISIGLIYAERKVVFEKIGGTSRIAAALLLTEILLCVLIGRFVSFNPGKGSSTLATLALLFLVWSGFSWFYGDRAFRAGLFPLLFLLLMLPLPAPLLERLILWLQWGSAEVTNWIFHATGTPVVRQGLVFTVPGVTIEITKDCSGIRSALALLITCLAAGYLLLRMTWARAVLLLAVVPVVFLKNGIRIAALTLLAVHVEPGFLFGRLHQEGGVVFFALGLVILLPILLWLQRVERNRSGLATIWARESRNQQQSDA
jgi:exosortase